MDLSPPAFVKSRFVRDDSDVKSKKNASRRLDVHSDWSNGSGLKTQPERMHRVLPILPSSSKSQKHRPPAVESRFRKTVIPNPTNTKSDFLFKQPRIENEHSEPSFGSKEIRLPTPNLIQEEKVTLELQPLQDQWETSREEFSSKREMLTPLLETSPLTSRETSVSTESRIEVAVDSVLPDKLILDSSLSETFCQTDVSLFNLTHNLSQTEPMFGKSTILKHSDTWSEPSNGAIILDKDSSITLQPDYPDLFRKEIVEITPSQTLSFSFLKLQDDNGPTPRSITILQRFLEFLTFGTFRADTIFRWYKTFNEFRQSPKFTFILNLVLWCIAFFVASFVIFVFISIIYPVITGLTSIFYSKPEPQNEESLAAEALLWLIDVMRAGSKALAKLLSKKRGCSVSVFSTSK